MIRLKISTIYSQYYRIVGQMNLQISICLRNFFQVDSVISFNGFGTFKFNQKRCLAKKLLVLNWNFVQIIERSAQTCITTYLVGPQINNAVSGNKRAFNWYIAYTVTNETESALVKLMVHISHVNSESKMDMHMCIKAG